MMENTFPCERQNLNIQGREKGSEDDLLFIQSVTQVKSALNHKCPLSEPYLADILNLSDFHRTADHIYSEDSERDSGIGNSWPLLSPENISNTSVAYLLRSEPIRKQLCSSVISVLGYIHDVMFVMDPGVLQRTIYNWKDSILENAVTAIVELIDSSSGEYQEYCHIGGEFITKAIDKIYLTEEIKTYSIIEQQCTIIIELSNSQMICRTAIDHIVKQMLVLSRKLKSCDLDATNLCPLDRIPISSVRYDTLFYLFFLLEKIMKIYCSTALDDKKDGTSENSATYSNIVEMWKLSWNGSKETSESSVEESMLYLREWEQALEETVVNTMDIFPNISFMAWSNLKTLQSAISSRADSHQRSKRVE